ncbi:hypothetical protein DX980_20280 [Burkholderia gladioli]|uniref:hypothetical protein n=1 Tax=Burkholderia gladioli TaxID=28095 RepID=UPI001364BBD2|nr:hypothetical protein [Burkholderia gladioli]KAF1065295.1 hypothetical protein LvStA_03970 [Burkholderia gladioli]WAG21382.1 hypothetical protein DX980_20280 [Burkholderia gladioli]
MIYGLLDIAGLGLVYGLGIALALGFLYIAFLVFRGIFFFAHDLFFDSSWPTLGEKPETIESVETLRRELREDPQILRKRFDDLMSRRGTEWAVYAQMETIRAFRRLHRAEWRHYKKLGLL